MHAASRRGTPSLTSLPKDGGVSVHLEVAHPVSDRTQPCLTSAKLMELAGPLDHSSQVDSRIRTAAKKETFFQFFICHDIPTINVFVIGKFFRPSSINALLRFAQQKF